MRYLQALAVVVFAASLVMAGGCEPQKTTSGTSQDAEAKIAQMQKQVDQMEQDLKAAQNKLNTELAVKDAEIQKLQKQLDAANATIAETTKMVHEAMKVAAPTVAPPPSAQ